MTNSTFPRQPLRLQIVETTAERKCELDVVGSRMTQLDNQIKADEMALNNVTKMSNLNLSDLQNAINRGEVASTLIKLKELYRSIDISLSSIANEAVDFPESSSLQSTLLEQKETLVTFAIQIKCRDIYEISHKVDFLNLVHLQEISADDFSETDCLTKSIWKDCQSFL